MLSVRKAEYSDIRLYFHWANDPVVRNNAFRSKPISWETHQAWFRHKIHDKNCFMYVFESNGTPVGQVRFDIVDNIAEIGYSVDHMFRGKGIGKEMLQSAINKLKTNCGHISIFKAKVKKQNIASNKIFMTLGFDVEEKDNIIIYSLTLKK